MGEPNSYYRCSGCENYIPGGRTSMMCKVTGNPIDNDCGFPTLWRGEGCPYSNNCHTYCQYAKSCRYAKGENGLKPEDCAMYWKIEEIINDAKMGGMAERSRYEEDEDW